MTFREFINEQEDDPYTQFMKMRQQAGWGALKASPRGTAQPVVDAPAATRTGTRNPAEVKLSNEVQTMHKMGGQVSPSVLARFRTVNSKDSLRSYVAADSMTVMKASQAYPFVQKRQAGKDVPGVIVYNQYFPLHSLLELLNLH